MDIEYIDRKSGKIEKEEVYGRWALSLLYGSSVWERFVSYFLLPLFAYFPWFSKFYGAMQKRPASAKKIEPFIKTYNVDPSEFHETTFACFNDFFIRKLNSVCRPVVQNPMVAALPADGRYLVFPNFRKASTFYIKGQHFDLQSFLGGNAYTGRYIDGSMLIARLCPTDYHRFHFPCDGIPGKPQLINGQFFSVNPIALRKKLSNLWENKRMVTEMQTERFGTILYVEVGATCVGTIQQTYLPDNPVRKGEEKGYFEFGGSCLVLLFEKGKIAFEPDLIQNSEKGLETKASFGQAMGKALP